jgi:uncharacterized membrane-anchored protein
MSTPPSDRLEANRTAIAARVHQELHERPPLDVQLPAHIHHVAYLLSDNTEERTLARSQVAELFRQLEIPDHAMIIGPRHAVAEKRYGNGDLLRVTWELHSEFVTYTLTHMAAEHRPLGFGPLQLLQHLPTTEPEWPRIVALDILVTDWPTLKEQERRHLFDDQRLYGSRIQEGSGEVWTTFQLDDGGWEHYLILAGQLTPAQLGRQIKRVVEVENYYHLILMPMERFRERSTELRELEVAFTRQTREMFDALIDAPPDEERRWLALLTEHSARVTRLKEAMRYRMGAAHSYNELFHRRLECLEEQRVEQGNQPLGTFLAARVDPAVRGYANFNDRLDSLSRGLDRATNMLRTRVEMTVQKQNLALLAGMAHQGRQQLALQMTVEGLSVIVLSYYLTGLFGYGAKALISQGWLHGVPELWQGAMIPVAIVISLGINWYVHRKVRRMAREQESEESSDAHP